MKQAWIIKVFPAYELGIPQELIEEGLVEPYEVRRYTYKGTVGQATWAACNSMGCYAKAFEMTKEECDAYEKQVKERMYSLDYENWLESEGFV